MGLKKYPVRKLQKQKIAKIRRIQKIQHINIKFYIITDGKCSDAPKADKQHIEDAIRATGKYFSTHSISKVGLIQEIFYCQR